MTEAERWSLAWEAAVIRGHKLNPLVRSPGGIKSSCTKCGETLIVKGRRIEGCVGKRCKPPTRLPGALVDPAPCEVEDCFGKGETDARKTGKGDPESE